MESFVQMSMKEYDTLKFNNEHLKRELKKEQESHSEDIAQFREARHNLAEKMEQYKQYILGYCCKWLDVENYSLEHYLNIDSFNYGMNYKDDLINLGFTKREMDNVIVDKYDEYVKEKEEDTDD